MFEFVSDVGLTVMSGLLQIALGCLASVPIRLSGCKQAVKWQEKPVGELLLIASVSICGMLLPMGTYGVIPLLAAFLAVGFRLHVVVPLALSNTIFNLLVPFTAVSFVWKTGIWRVILAFMLGVIGGVLLKWFKLTTVWLVRGATVLNPGSKPSGFLQLFHNIRDAVNVLGAFLVAGAFAGVFFRKYGLTALFGLFFKNRYTAVIPRFFSGFDVGDPLFMMAMTIVTALLDLTLLSALLALFRPKGFIACMLFYSAMAVLLAVPVMIHRM